MDNFSYFSEIYLQNFSENREGLANRIVKAKNVLKKIDLSNMSTSLDLGCGSGAYSLALCDLGFSEIHAVDYCTEVLHPLLRTDNRIQTHILDIRLIDNSMFQDMDLILCTGDTILYLDNVEEIGQLFSHASNMLNHSGVFLLEFRDFSVELPVLERFKTSKLTESYIKNIGLIYEDGYLFTIDIINKKVDGNWVTQKGVSRKLRVASDQIYILLEENNFKIRDSIIMNGNITLVVCKK